MIKQLIRLLCLLLFCSYSLAESNLSSLFYVNASDASLSVLGQLFGNVGTVLTGNSIIVSKMFGYFNNGILAFTTVLLTYTMFVTVIDTANDGKTLGNKFNYFTVIRAGVGLSSLVPFVNGYCAVQVVIMWTIIQGIGFANYLWTQSVVMISTNGGFSSSSMQNTYGSNSENAATVEGLAMGASDPNGSYNTSIETGVPVTVLLRSALCTQAVYNYDVAAAAINKTSKPMSDDYGYFVEENKALCFGTRFVSSSGASSYNCQCGEYQVPAGCISSGTVPQINADGADNSTDLYLSNASNIITIAATVMSFAKNLYVTLENKPASSICPSYVEPGTNANCNAATNVISIASLYAQYVGAYQLSQTASDPKSSCPDWVQTASSEGWMLAVSHYYDMTSISSTSCSATTLYNYVCMMPYSISGYSSNNIIANSDYKLCMTQNSGYSGANLCNSLYLDKTATAAWDNAGALLTQVFSYKDMIQYLYSTAISTVSSDTSLLNSYYDDMLVKYINVFARNDYTPGELGTDIMNMGNQRPIVNGMIALVTQVVGKVLGFNPYNANGNLKPKDLFAYDIVSNSLPSTTSQCKNNCRSLADCKGCLTDEGWGLLGAIYAENYPEEATQTDPISGLKEVGKDALIFSIGYITHTIENVYRNLKNTAVGAASWLITSAGVFSAIASLLQTGTGQMAVFGFTAINMIISILTTIHKTLLMAWMPVAATVAAIFMTIGIILYMYIPFLPFLLFFSGVISWVIAVVEAMVAAPMIAMGITHPKGADFLGKAEQSAMLLLAVFIRPAAIIIGFILAISLSYVAMRLLNISFAVLFIQAFDAIEGNSAGSKLLGGTSLMIVYTYCCIAILSQTFSLIYQIPDKIMRWIGMPQDQTSSSAMEMVRGAKTGVSDISGGAASAAGDSARSSGVGDYKVDGVYESLNSRNSNVRSGSTGQSAPGGGSHSDDAAGDNGDVELTDYSAAAAAARAAETAGPPAGLPGKPIDESKKGDGDS
jgi:conjugal transfer/type IV secretion protein DotA/TraY